MKSHHDEKYPKYLQVFIIPVNSPAIERKFSQSRTTKKTCSSTQIIERDGAGAATRGPGCDHRSRWVPAKSARKHDSSAHSNLGISGLAALKECLAAGFDAQVFETRDRIGGAWAYQECSSPGEDVHSSIYEGTMLNSCRDTSSFTDFPLDPARYGDYFSHRLMVRYLEEYVDHFGLRDHIQLRTRILECSPLGDRGQAGWRVKLARERDERAEEEEKEEELLFTAVMVCTGHLSTPMTPEFEGRDKFTGEFFHSHFYRHPGPFRGKKVAIIGLGSSAVDIACEIAPHAKEVHVITRRGGWILPRYVLGKPTEAWDSKFIRPFPFPLGFCLLNLYHLAKF